MLDFTVYTQGFTYRLTLSKDNLFAVECRDSVGELVERNSICHQFENREIALGVFKTTHKKLLERAK